MATEPPPRSPADSAQPKTRQRLLDAASELFRSQGYAATGLKQLTEQANAPFGSLYHHFPGGKRALAVEMIRASADYYAAIAMTNFDADADIVTNVERFFIGAAQHMRESNYTQGCPIATIALETAATDETLREATAEVFGRWLDDLAALFVAADISPGDAERLSLQTLSMLEGAFVLCQSTRSTAALDAAGQAMAALVAATLDADR